MSRSAHTASGTAGTAPASDAGEAGSGGLRERKKRATRQALQQAAVRLFREHGPGAVTVEDICASADVSPRTFFNYFTSKEEVLVPWDRDTIDNTSTRVLERPPEEEPLEVARAVLGEAIGTAMSGPTWRDQAVVLRHHPELIEKIVTSFRTLEASLAEGFAARLGRTAEDVYVRLLSATTITTLRVSVQSWQDSESDESLRHYLDETFERLRQGLRPNELG
ncbi:transcriptional regulator, TetR family [Actinopolyspora lacussalsi subsp. righensis]|uniref:Transcriptional regulator, TetR family n=1 Tax=Actinopolyspora righensis TaxID=995060 RepID=A0A1I6Y9B4_9ACTN|nr:TetR/AcrR family transcriptional regulator [Actinopolyspora righensis]SFT47056.1 transcriptional regulator, TetR family [Actinopolyspora righensis]